MILLFDPDVYILCNFTMQHHWAYKSDKALS